MSYTFEKQPNLKYRLIKKLKSKDDKKPDPKDMAVKALDSKITSEEKLHGRNKAEC